MTRKYNFSAGPAMLPQPVLEQAQAELLDWNGTGQSVMEMSHRGKEFMSIAETAEADLREVMNIPDNYKVLFLQGGATSQFAAIPLNLLRGKEGADYVNTGIWSTKAITEASRYCLVNVVSNSESSHFTSIQNYEEWNINPDAAYLHYTPNETIAGVEFPWVPDTGEIPLVADMSSNILSRPVDVSEFGLIYAGAQKNIGPAGLTIVIVREDLIGDAMDITPTMLNYDVHAKNGSMYNTPSTYAWYLAGLIFKWLKQQGGLEQMEILNRRKAAMLYDCIDNSDFYSNPVDKEYRSLMNVPFTLANSELNEKFLTEAATRDLVYLKGHKSVGGMRASIYNAMPEQGVIELVDMMKSFETKYG
ncbi:3-phosphoserine/phosphohydroxythreonine transaminase [Cocleimonas flava]|uniref:Phosphoserine aminotransferase n=1 Tax=Cocleimonas flava TaxID=634765 RepID=A0A4R1F337_9GAMM|nr:3-phosphoserine/phosphohydroxythreonine transaminase [Cocleimonas flava]TCJ86944.1 phosphoserine aminotransferase [Cocleimonas flava]